MEDVPLSDERRREIRQRMLKGGKIVFGGGSFIMDCTIRNLTGSGAKLRVSDSKDVPENIQLFTKSDEKITAGKVIWRTTRELGVEFSGEPVPVREASDPRIRSLRA
ncbi:MAG: PilZ domain-containing protein [Stappiaceae bacterium]